MELVDLSRELYHRTAHHPSHPPVVVTVWNDHSEVKSAGGFDFTSKSLTMSLSDHSGTHVDAFCHFDPDPEAESIDRMALERFYTSAICLDLGEPPPRHAVTVPEMEAALEASGEEIRQGDTVLLAMGVNRRMFGTPAYGHEFPGLATESVHWLADRGIGMFGVEAVSPAPEGELNFRAHRACAERRITHMECLANLEAVVGRGRFRFIGFPLRIRGGTGSPIRAVAVFE